MNGYTYWKNLEKIQETMFLSPPELALLEALARFNNMTGWNESFTPRNSWLMKRSGFKEVKTLKKWRTSLITKGLIKFEPIKRNAGIYRFTEKLGGNIYPTNEVRGYILPPKDENRGYILHHLNKQITRVDRYTNINKENPTVVNLMESKLVQQNLDYVLGELREWFSLYPNEAQRQQLKRLIVPYSQMQLGEFISKMVLNHVESGKEFAYLTTILRNNAYNMKKERRVRR